jgi:transposase
MSRRPHTIDKIDKKVEQKTFQIKKQHRYYPARIKEILQNQYNIKIGHMIVYRILRKNQGYSTKKLSCVYE